MADLFDLTGKTALITGAARGIGLEFARAYIAQGARVALADINAQAVAQAAERLGLPWMASNATTDDANGESAGDFSANLARAARRAAEAAETLILEV